MPTAPIQGPAPVSASRSVQLDGLRGVAIVLVFLHHSGLLVPWWLEWGQTGVRLFFVLSGYLITLSVWRMDDRCAGAGIRRAGELGIFQLRRLARLLPAFLAALGIGLLAGMEHVVEPIWWHLAFLTNVKTAMQGWFFGPTAHFWSLSMQEQFYLVWPLVLFAVPRRWFPLAALGLVGLGFGYRVWCVEAGISDYWRWLMVPGSIDAFALGGLVAWVKSGPGLPGIPGGVAGRWLLAGGLSGWWILNRVLRNTDAGPWISSGAEVLEAGFAAAMVWGCVQGFPGPAGRFFSWGPLCYLGKISYGIFVYHLILMFALEPLAAEFGIGPRSHVAAWIAVSGAVTVAVSAASWHFLEAPAVERAKEWINRLFQPGGEVRESGTRNPVPPGGWASALGTGFRLLGRRLRQFSCKETGAQ